MKKVGLALGGGAVLGAAHVGVIKAIKEFKIPVSHVSGTSIGSFIGALLALGLDYDKIYELTNKMDWLDVTSLTISQLGLLSNKKMGKIIAENSGNNSFSDCKIDFSVVATNVGNGNKKIFNKGKLSEAIMASSCIPGIFKPIEINNNYYIDGGLLENVPFSPLKNDDLDFIIGVDLIKKKILQRPKNLIELLTNSIAIATNQYYIDDEKKADIMIYPEIADFSFTNTNKIKELIEKGYEAAKEEFKNLDLT